MRNISFSFSNLLREKEGREKEKDQIYHVIWSTDVLVWHTIYKIFLSYLLYMLASKVEG